MARPSQRRATRTRRAVNGVDPRSSVVLVGAPTAVMRKRFGRIKSDPIKELEEGAPAKHQRQRGRLGKSDHTTHMSTSAELYKSDLYGSSSTRLPLLLSPILDRC